MPFAAPAPRDIAVAGKNSETVQQTSTLAADAAGILERDYGIDAGEVLSMNVDTVETVTSSSEVTASDAEQILKDWEFAQAGFSSSSSAPKIFTSYTSRNDATSFYDIIDLVVNADGKKICNFADATPAILANTYTGAEGTKPEDFLYHKESRVQTKKAGELYTFKNKISPVENDTAKATYTTTFGMDEINEYNACGEAWWFFKADTDAKSGYALVWDNHNIPAGVVSDESLPSQYRSPGMYFDGACGPFAGSYTHSSGTPETGFSTSDGGRTTTIDGTSYWYQNDTSYSSTAYPEAGAKNDARENNRLFLVKVDNQQTKVLGACAVHHWYDYARWKVTVEEENGKADIKIEAGGDSDQPAKSKAHSWVMPLPSFDGKSMTYKADGIGGAVTDPDGTTNSEYVVPAQSPTITKTASGSMNIYNYKVDRTKKNTAYNAVQFKGVDVSMTEGAGGNFAKLSGSGKTNQMFGVYNFAAAYFADNQVDVTKMVTKSFGDIVYEPSWTDGALHMLINIDTKPDGTMLGSDGGTEMLCS